MCLCTHFINIYKGLTDHLFNWSSTCFPHYMSISYISKSKLDVGIIFVFSLGVYTVRILVTDNNGAASIARRLGKLAIIARRLGKLPSIARRLGKLASIAQRLVKLASIAQRLVKLASIARRLGKIAIIARRLGKLASIAR